MKKKIMALCLVLGIMLMPSMVLAMPTMAPSHEEPVLVYFQVLDYIPETGEVSRERSL